MLSLILSCRYANRQEQIYIMIVSKIHLENFRNYSQVTLIPDAGINVLFGNNGQGKTNVIESIYMCACARSHRTAKDAELIKHGENSYKIDLNYFSSNQVGISDDYEQQIGIHYKQLQGIGNSKNERLLYKDEIVLSRVSDFVGNFHAVMFAPEDLQLIKDGPSARRRFLDLLLSQIKPSYFQQLQLFARILRQRNTLLKYFRDQEKKPDSVYLEQLVIWNEQYAKSAAQVITERLQLIDKLTYWSANLHKQISGGAEDLRLIYRTIPGIEIDSSNDNIIDNIFNRLQKNQTEDINRGNTSIGPHRDDFDLLVNKFSLRSFGSQGQQRTAVLALKMAELEIIRKSCKESPILLLDDVMSELDFGRREQLLSCLQNVQIFVTCTDPDQLDKNWLSSVGNDVASYYRVADSTITKISDWDSEAVL